MSKRILITGATGAVGAATARAFAAKGDVELVLISRNSEKLQQLKNSINGKNVIVDTLVMDLSDSTSIEMGIKKLKANYQRFHAIINIAAIYKSKKTMTAQRREMMFATNHLGPFALTTGLLELVQSTPGSKVLTVTAPSSTSVNFENLNSEKKFSSLGVFGATKMMNLLFSFYLAKKLSGTSHAALAFHPGLVKSELLNESSVLIRGLFKLIASGPEKTANAITELILSENVQGQNGKFYNKKLKEIKANPKAMDESIQKKLWKVSEEMLDTPQKLGVM